VTRFLAGLVMAAAIALVLYLATMRPSPLLIDDIGANA
jgi:hypothetical protein